MSPATTTSGATIYYTLDGTTPSASSQQYFAPFLVASKPTVKAVAAASGYSTPDWSRGSIHGMGFTGDSGLGTIVNFPSGQTAAEWHTYGMIWSKGLVAYYVDDPGHPYITYTPSSLTDLSGAVWPFDAGQGGLIILNLAVGGKWPGAPNSTTSFPGEMLVDYVRVYTD